MIMGESFNFRADVGEGRFSLATLNSLTKYPSIDTYHALGAKGVLRELKDSAVDVSTAKWPPAARFSGMVEITEKVDGTNARVIVLPDGTVIIGSREELLWATGDLIHNPALNIVDTLHALGVPIGARAQLSQGDRIRVIYGEVYGDGIGGAGKRYSAGRRGLTGFRVFDVASVPVEGLVWSSEEASNWRKQGGQQYESSEVVKTTAEVLGVERVPRVGLVLAHELPQTIADTAQWLKTYAPRSRVALAQRDGELCEAEGVVLRGIDTAAERLLAKIRFEDYRRTEREQSKNAGRAPHVSKPLKRKLGTI